MRAGVAVGFLVLLCPAALLAQTPSAPDASQPAPAARSRGGDITRDEYIERAKRNAEKRFERLDLNHDGVLTPDERRAARGRKRAPQSE